MFYYYIKLYNDVKYLDETILGWHKVTFKEIKIVYVDKQKMIAGERRYHPATNTHYYVLN